MNIRDEEHLSGLILDPWILSSSKITRVLEHKLSIIELMKTLLIYKPNIEDNGHTQIITPGMSGSS